MNQKKGVITRDPKGAPCLRKTFIPSDEVVNGFVRAMWPSDGHALWRILTRDPRELSSLDVPARGNRAKLARATAAALDGKLISR